MKVLISPVSLQSAPILSILWDSSIEDPTDVLLYVSENPKIKETALKVKEIFEAKGIRVVLHKCKNAENIESVKNELLELKAIFTQISKDNNFELSINITPGTKIQSSLMVDVFSDNDEFKFFYISRNNSIQFFNKRYEILETKKLNFENFDIDLYLKAYSCYTKNNHNNDYNEYLKVVETVGRLSTIRAKKDSVHPISSWNYNLYKQNSNLTLPEDPKVISEVFKREGILNELVKFENSVYKFCDETSRDFAHGIWFEYLIFMKLKKLMHKYNITCLRNGVDIITKNSSSERNNELDIVFFRNGTLYIIECKAMSFKYSKKRDDYKKICDKLNLFNNLGGLNTKLAIACIDNEIHTNLKQYSNNLNIGLYLKDGDENFENWFKKFIGFEENE